MKRKIIAVIFILVIAITSLMVVNISDVSAKEAATGHVVRDYVDHIWHCVGSPVNCAKS